MNCPECDNKLYYSNTSSIFDTVKICLVASCSYIDEIVDIIILILKHENVPQGFIEQPSRFRYSNRIKYLDHYIEMLQVSLENSLNIWSIQLYLIIEKLRLLNESDNYGYFLERCSEYFKSEYIKLTWYILNKQITLLE